MRSGSSSVCVAPRMRSRKRSSASSAILASISSSVSSRISSARIGVRLLARNEFRFHAQLRRRESHGALRRLPVDAFQLEHDAPRLDHRHPTLGRALSLSHSRFRGLLRHRLVGEDANPHLAAALDVTRERHAGRLDLPVGYPPRLERLQSVLSERHRCTARRDASGASLEHLPKLDALWTQHFPISLGAGRVRAAATARGILAAEDPHLHADRAERRLRRARGVVDLRAQRVQRYTTFVVALDARDLRAAKPSAALDLDSLRAGAHRALHRALHRATKRDPLRELVRDVVRDELRVELGMLDLLDVDADFLARELCKLVAQLVDFRALLSDHDTRTPRVDGHDDLPRLALDREIGDRRVPEARVQILAEQLVFLEQRREVAVGVQLRAMLACDPQPEADRIRFLSHYFPSFSATTISTWLVRLKIGVPRPIAAGMKRLSFGPSLMIASLM